jgi:hypothetical protein
MPRRFFMLCAIAILGPFLEEKSSLEDFKAGHEDAPNGPDSVPERGALFTRNGTDGSRDALILARGRWRTFWESALTADAGGRTSNATMPNE